MLYDWILSSIKGMKYCYKQYYSVFSPVKCLNAAANSFNMDIRNLHYYKSFLFSFGLNLSSVNGCFLLSYLYCLYYLSLM